MSVSTEFKEIVAKGDKNAVRTSLANYMILDRSYSLFDEAYSYAASQMDILDAHDGQELTQDRTKWTEEYLNDRAHPTYQGNHPGCNSGFQNRCCTQKTDQSGKAAVPYRVYAHRNRDSPYADTTAESTGTQSF